MLFGDPYLRGSTNIFLVSATIGVILLDRKRYGLKGLTGVCGNMNHASVAYRNCILLYDLVNTCGERTHRLIFYIGSGNRLGVLGKRVLVRNIYRARGLYQLFTYGKGNGLLDTILFVFGRFNNVRGLQKSFKRDLHRNVTRSFLFYLFNVLGNVFRATTRSVRVRSITRRDRGGILARSERKGLRVLVNGLRIRIGTSVRIRARGIRERNCITIDLVIFNFHGDFGDLNVRKDHYRLVGRETKTGTRTGNRDRGGHGRLFRVIVYLSVNCSTKTSKIVTTKTSTTSSVVRSASEVKITSRRTEEKDLPSRFSVL